MRGSEPSKQSHGADSSEPSHNIDWFIFISTAIIFVGVTRPASLRNGRRNEERN
jgi:hypothetical protein